MISALLAYLFRFLKIYSEKLYAEVYYYPGCCWGIKLLVFLLVE